jgi:hypothetical protein
MKNHLFTDGILHTKIFTANAVDNCTHSAIHVKEPHILSQHCVQVLHPHSSCLSLTCLHPASHFCTPSPPTSPNPIKCHLPKVCPQTPPYIPLPLDHRNKCYNRHPKFLIVCVCCVGMCVGVCVKEREREKEEWDGNVYLSMMQTKPPQGLSRESPEHTEACHKHTYTPRIPITLRNHHHH